MLACDVLCGENSENTYTRIPLPQNSVFHFSKNTNMYSKELEVTSVKTSYFTPETRHQSKENEENVGNNSN